MEQMTLNHQKWDEFYNKLSEAVVKNGCTSEPDRQNALNVLREMGFDDQSIEASLEYFTEYSGHCDCEILMNVDYVIRDY